MCQDAAAVGMFAEGKAQPDRTLRIVLRTECRMPRSLALDQILTKQVTAAKEMLVALCREDSLMPRTVNIGDAKAMLSRLIAQAEAGEDAIISRNGIPAVRIVPLEASVGKAIALLRQERARRPPVRAVEIRAARNQGRA